MNLTLTRVIGLVAALGAGLTAFTGAATSSGGYKGAIVAAFSAVVLTWLHEEHSTERNETTAAASMKQAPAPAPSLPQELANGLHALEGLLPHAPVTTGGGQAPPPPATAPAPPAAS